DQRAAVDRALALDLNRKPFGSTPRTAVLAGFRPLADPRAPYEDALSKAEPIIAAHLQRDLVGAGNGVRTTVLLLKETSTEHPTALAWTEQVLSGGQLTECAFFVNPSLQGQVDPGVLANAMAHEMFHCFQDDLLVRTGRDKSPIGGWIVEGEAAWAGESTFQPSK